MKLTPATHNRVQRARCTLPVLEESSSVPPYQDPFEFLLQEKLLAALLYRGAERSMDSITAIRWILCFCYRYIFNSFLGQLIALSSICSGLCQLRELRKKGKKRISYELT